MSWSIYLPIAGISVNFLMFLGLGGAVGFLAGLFGVGGGFLMTPMLITAGIPALVAAASDSNQIVGASTSGAFAHYRMGNVDFKMALLLLIGGVVGGTIGVQVIKILRTVGDADFVIRRLVRGTDGDCRVLHVLGESTQPHETASHSHDCGPNKSIGVRKGNSRSPLPDEVPEIRCDSFPSAATDTGRLCGNSGSDHGHWRRIHDGAGNGIPFAHAHARGSGDEPAPRAAYMYQRYHNAGRN